MTTLGTLKIGTVITYNDSSNINLESIVIGNETNDFGVFVKVIKKETNNIELLNANTEIDNRRWSVVANG